MIVSIDFHPISSAREALALRGIQNHTLELASPECATLRLVDKSSEARRGCRRR